MPRKPSFYWEVERGVYRTDTGGKTKRFPGIARDDHARIGIAFDEYLRELDAAERPPEPTVDDLCLLFVKACTSGRGVSARTARSHKERLTVFSEFAPDEKTPIIGSRPASTLAARDLKNAIRHWEQEGLSGHYRAGICRSVKAACAWAATEDGGYILKSNPMAEVRAPATGRSPERYSDRREIAAFLRFLWRRAGASPGIYRRFGRMLALMVRTAWHAGARPGDLAAAWRDDYDSEPMSITLPPERHKTGRKTGRSRVIFLTPTLVRALNRLLAMEGAHPVSIFTHKRGKGSVDHEKDSTCAQKRIEQLQGEPWGKFVTLPNGRPSFITDTGPLCQAIRKIRAEAVAEAKRLKKAKLPTRGLELIQDEGDNRLVLYRLRHTTLSDNLMDDGNPHTVAELHGTSVRMLETTYAHLLKDHLSATAADLTAKRRAAKGRVAAKGGAVGK